MNHKSNGSTTPHAAGASSMRSEIEGKWGKFNATEIAVMKSNADLVALLQAKYSLDKGKAQTEVDIFAKGRSL